MCACLDRSTPKRRRVALRAILALPLNAEAASNLRRAGSPERGRRSANEKTGRCRPRAERAKIRAPFEASARSVPRGGLPARPGTQGSFPLRHIDAEAADERRG